jgi:hypothetical protein
MARSERPTVPPPLVQAFVVCREIFEDTRTKEFILIGPHCERKPVSYPARFPMPLYVLLTAGHGIYDLDLQLRDGEEQVLWKWRCPNPITLLDPLKWHRIVLFEAVMEFPRPGRYNVVLVVNGEDLARHPLQLHPAPRRKEERGNDPEREGEP